MEVSAVLLARSIGFVDINDLNPTGKIFFPYLVPLLAERYSFQTVPSKPEDFDESKGVSFTNGYFQGQSIDNLTVYNDGIKIDLRSSTEEGQNTIKEMLGWLSGEVGIKFSPRMLNRWAFVSQITFHSELNLDLLNPALTKLSQRLSSMIKERIGTERIFRPAGISLNFERLEGKINMSSFSIERREQTRHSENKYFSAAPLETAQHLQLLEEFEKDMLVAKK